MDTIVGFDLEVHLDATKINGTDIINKEVGKIQGHGSWKQPTKDKKIEEFKRDFMLNPSENIPKSYVFDWEYNTINCACFSWRDVGGTIITDGIVDIKDEKRVMIESLKLIEHIMQTTACDPTFAGNNIFGFDVPNYKAKIMKYDLLDLAPKLLSGRKYLFPNSKYNNAYIDFQTIFPKKTLGSLSKAFLGEGKFNGLDGSQVDRLVKEGKVDEILDYCKSDSKQHLLIAEKVQF